MTAIKFSKAENAKIDSIINNFFWGENQDSKRAPHLLQSRFLKLPKKMGGLGLRDINSTNRIMLAKSTWRFINQPHSLVSKWVSNKYIKKSVDWDPRNPSSASFLWKGIKKCSTLITDHLRWQVGSGNSIAVSSKFWVAPLTTSDASLKVASFINHSVGTWNVTTLNSFYNPNQILNIIKLPIWPRMANSLAKMDTKLYVQLSGKILIDVGKELIFLGTTSGNQKCRQEFCCLHGNLFMMQFLCQIHDKNTTSW